MVPESPELCFSSEWSGLKEGGREGSSIQSKPSSFIQCSGVELGRTFSGEILRSIHGLPAEVADHVVHHGLVAKEDGSHHFVVDDLGAVPRHRSHAPQQEETLEPEGRKHR